MKAIKTLALLLLIVGGLVHLAPGHLMSIAQMGTGYLTVQRLVGLLSIVVALVLITKKECK